MGYSARYHAASLAAIFVALAVGVVIGVGLGNSPRKGLENSLRGDVKSARSDADRFGAALRREREFATRVYPTLIGERLKGRRVGLIALGSLPEDVSADIQAALQPTGAVLSEVAVVRLPPNLDGLAAKLPSKRWRQVAAAGPGLDRYAQRAGTELVSGGVLVRRTSDQLLRRASGALSGVDDVILVRDRPANMSGADLATSDRFEAGLLAGIQSTNRPAVAVERTDAATSSVGFFRSKQIPTVDDIDLVAGRVAMVFSLLGAEGNFGVKGSADRLLPELLVPSQPATGP